MNYEHLRQEDAEIFAAMEQELTRQRDHIELIASENFTSPAVMEAVGSHLTNKYAEGYPGKRFYGGCEYVDIVENICRDRAKELFGAEHANVQPHSGSQANVAVYLALTKPGDVIMGMDLACGGHLTHGAKASITGKYFDVRPYGVDPTTELIDYDEMRRMARELQPKMIISGASAYSRIIDWARIREICDEVGAYMFVDMAHIGGLVAGGAHPSPVPYADVVTTTTHKTLRGPRGAIILCKEELAKKIDSAIFPGTQGGPLEHIIAAKAVCFGEALKPEFKTYQEQVIKNAQAFAKALTDEGFRLVSGGTDNHLILIDLQNMNITGKDLEKRLDAVYITANKNAIPNDPQSAFVTSGLRVGTPAVTTRGFKEEDMVKVAHFIKLAATDFDAKADEIRAGVTELCNKYPIYE